MVNIILTVNLTPPLTGVLGKLCTITNGTIDPYWDLPLSVNGRISLGITADMPEIEHVVLFPEQTIEGVTYVEAVSEVFNFLTDVTLNITLYEEGVIPPPPPVESLLPGIASAILGALAVRWGLSPG